MDIYQFVDKVEGIWEEIENLEREAPPHCSVIIALLRRCTEELGNVYYDEQQRKNLCIVEKEVKPK